MFFGLLTAFAFLHWMRVLGPQCANITLGPSLGRIEWCPFPAWIVTMEDEVGVAACNDTDIFISIDDKVVHVDSVAEMQGVLRA